MNFWSSSMDELSLGPFTFFFSLIVYHNNTSASFLLLIPLWLSWLKLILISIWNLFGVLFRKEFQISPTYAQNNELLTLSIPLSEKITTGGCIVNPGQVF